MFKFHMRIPIIINYSYYDFRLTIHRICAAQSIIQYTMRNLDEKHFVWNTNQNYFYVNDNISQTLDYSLQVVFLSKEWPQF